jgi:exopolyphosphatase/guanosine-5'-triphosphate,3'-diphosphate pyrophosphatase
MDRTIEALRVCSNKLVWHKVKKHRLIATEACRMASNGAEFITRALRNGLELEIIDRETSEAGGDRAEPLIDPDAKVP